MVLGGQQRHSGGAVGDDEQRHLGTVKVLLDHEAAPASQALSRMAQGFFPVVGDHDALTCRQPVVLDHIGGGERVQRDGDLDDIGAHDAAGCGHPGRGHDLFCECLTAFELGRCSGRAEAPQSTFSHCVRSPMDQGELGSDDHQVRRHPVRQIGDGGGVAHVDRPGRAVQRDAGIAGGAHDLGDGGLTQELLDQRVLAGPRSDDEDLHRRPSATNRRPVTCLGVISM